MLSFYPNCTLPSQAAGYVAAPNIRSTLEIVWDCVSILILCSWSILHLNVPGQYTPHSTLQKFRRYAWSTMRKAKWMLVSLVAPEFIAAKALMSYRSAQLNYPALKEFADEDAVPWSMAHTFLADMGGLVIHFPESCPEPGEAHEGGAVDDPGRGRNMPAHQFPSPNRCSDRHGLSAQNHNEVPRIEPITVPSNNDGEARADSDIAFAPPTPTENIAARDVPIMPDSISPAQGERQMNDETDALTESEQMLQAESAHSPKLRPRPGEPQRRMTYDSTYGNTPAIVHMKPYGTRKLNRMKEKFRLNQEKATHKYGASTWRLHAYNASLGQAIFSENPPYRFTVLCSIIHMEGNIWVLNSTQLQYARAFGIVSKLHSITEDELDDKGKGDFVAKVLALFQVTRMIIQLAVRAVTPDRPSAPLEIATLAFATLAFVTYLLLFKHPQDLKTPLQVSASRLPTIDEFRTIAIMSPDSFWSHGPGADEFIPNNTCHRRGENDLGQGSSSWEVA